MALFLSDSFYRSLKLFHPNIIRIFQQNTKTKTNKMVLIKLFWKAEKFFKKLKYNSFVNQIIV